MLMYFGVVTHIMMRPAPLIIPPLSGPAQLCLQAATLLRYFGVGAHIVDFVGTGLPAAPTAESFTWLPDGRACHTSVECDICGRWALSESPPLAESVTPLAQSAGTCAMPAA